jgi:transposase-like protein
MIETASLSSEEKSAWCRSKGLHTQQLDQWKQDFLSATGASPGGQPKRSLKESRLNKKVRTLEKDLQRKEKALAEASALLLLKKKADEIWGDHEDD